MVRFASAWLPPLSITALVLLVVLLSVVYHLLPLAVTAQLALLLVLLRSLWYWTPLNRWMRSMPGAHRAVLGVLIVGMILGHFSLNGRSYFPFVVWEIFPSTHAPDPVTCREFIGKTADGRSVRLLPEQLFPSIIQVDPVDSLDDARLYPPGTTAALAQALGRMYNAHHPGHAVRAVELTQVAVRLHPPPGETSTQPSCELLQRYAILSEPSN